MCIYIKLKEQFDKHIKLKNKNNCVCTNFRLLTRLHQVKYVYLYIYISKYFCRFYGFILILQNFKKQNGQQK